MVTHHREENTLTLSVLRVCQRLLEFGLMGRDAMSHRYRIHSLRGGALSPCCAPDLAGTTIHSTMVLSCLNAQTMHGSLRTVSLASSWNSWRRWYLP